MKKTFFCFLFISLSNIFAQNATSEQQNTQVTTQNSTQNASGSTPQQVETPQNKPNTIENQFTDIIETSNNWEQYKVISKVRIATLKRNVQDTLQRLYNLNNEKNKQILEFNQNIEDLKQQVASSEQQFNDLRDEKNSISFFGINLSKELYSFVMGGIILILSVSFGFLLYRFKSANAITKKSVKDLQELQDEYEEFRKKSIEREQKVRRELQDYINKHK